MSQRVVKGEFGLKLSGGDGIALMRRALDMALAAQNGDSGPMPGVSGGGAAAVRAPGIGLDGAESVADALRRIFRASIANIVANEPAARAGSDPEGVHQMRVSLQRLRTALLMFGRMLERDSVVWMKRELNWLASGLGRARDWDVFIGETLAAVEGAGIDDAAIDALRGAAEPHRAQAYDEVRAILGSARYARLLLRMTAFAETVEWMPRPSSRGSALPDPLAGHARALLARPRRRLMRAAQGIETMDAAGRHAVRIRLKKLRYAAEFLRGLYRGGGRKTYLRALKDLQDLFGHLNDVRQIEALLDEIAHGAGDDATSAALQRAGGAVVGWYAHQLHGLEPRFLDDWNRFAALKPFWKAGRAKVAA